jgi:hypothetical protein
VTRGSHRDSSAEVLGQLLPGQRRVERVDLSGPRSGDGQDLAGGHVAGVHDERHPEIDGLKVLSLEYDAAPVSHQSVPFFHRNQTGRTVGPAEPMTDNLARGAGRGTDRSPRARR